VTRRRAAAEQYVDDVLEGRQVAGKWVRLACERYLRDRKRKDIRLDRAAAFRAIEFCKRFCRHSKGEWAGRPLELEPWQAFLLWQLFGWKRRTDGRRRFRHLYLEVSRKNGKTTLLSAIGLYLLDADGEPGAEIYTAATKRDQARIMHGESVRMVKTSAELSQVIECYRDNLSVPETASKYEPLGADSKTLDGLNIHGALIDELHAHPNGDLYNVLDTATGSRRQPIVATITTAGQEETTFCGEMHEYTAQVLDGRVDDDGFLGLIYSLDDDDDWRDPAVWVKANPNLGVSVQREALARDIERAQTQPGRQNEIRRYRLNQWARRRTRYLDLDQWDPCAGDLGPRELEASCRGRAAFAGIDLASRIDLAALALVIEPEDPDRPVYPCLWRFWIPEESVAEKVRDHGLPYDAWIREGWITATPGEVIDYAWIQREALTLANVYRVSEIAYDPWGAQALATGLENEGLLCVKYAQSFSRMNEPTLALEALVRSRRLVHGGHPVARWMAGNLEVKTDPSGAVRPWKPDHKMSHRRIDGMVALIMALGRAFVGVAPEQPEPRVVNL
jgi:phage terminase large subunit-like protein